MAEKVTHDKIVKQNRWMWIVMLTVVLLTSAIRVRLLSVPLERDEGEYAYAGQLMLQGIPPYEKAYNMKMPGIYAAYAGTMAIFGQTTIGIHLGLLFINIATTLSVFLLAKELFNTVVGLFAGVIFALLSLGQAVFGFFAHAEHFVILPAVAGILLLRKFIYSQKYLFLLVASLLLGVAFIMMQHGAAFILFAAFYLLICEIRRRPFNWKLFTSKGILFSVGVFLPFFLTSAILWHFGVFERFWFWTFDYARHYVALVPFDNGLFLLKEGMIKITCSAVWLWSLAGIGLFFLFFDKYFRQQLLFVSGFLVFSFLAICPGLYFREHYYILLLPAVALLAGIGAAGIYEFLASIGNIFLSRFIPVILALAVLAFTLYQQRNFFFIYTPARVSRMSYGLSPFIESLEIANFIRENSQETDTIAVIGSEPQIYFYSGRHSATGYIYTYALMEEQPYSGEMLNEMIQQIEQATPKFLVVVGIPSSWLTRTLPDAEERIWNLFERYPLKNYNLIGAVDIISLDKTVYCWGSKAAEYILQSPSWMAVLLDKHYDPGSILWPQEDLAK